MKLQPFIAPSNLHPDSSWRRGYEDAANGKERNNKQLDNIASLYYNDGYNVAAVILHSRPDA